MLAIWTKKLSPISFSNFSDCPDVIGHIVGLGAKLSP